MSGVVVGTRLQRLYELQRQVKVAIEVELRQKHDVRPTNCHRPARTVDPHDQVNAAPYEIKEWAVAQGLLPAVVRGRVSDEVRQAYIDAHAHTKDGA